MKYPHFPTTQWTMLYRARDGAMEGESLHQLIDIYSSVLRVYLQSKGLPDHLSDEIVQAFVSDKILEQDLFAKANHERGRFRTFLLAALNNFASNYLRKERRHDSPAHASAAIQEDILASRNAIEPSDEFNRAWASEVLTRTLQIMQAECGQAGMDRVWRVFETRVVHPTLMNREPVSYEQLAKSCGFESKAQVGNTLVTAKRMFRRLLRRVVREYTRTDEEVDEEIRELQNLFS